MSEKERFQTLDVMRGVAAILVVTYHWFEGQRLHWLPSAFLALDFFFLMSGFVVAYAYDRPLASTMSVKQFLVVRFIRLWPMIVLGALVGLLRVALHDGLMHIEHPPGELLKVTLDQMLMIPDLHNTGTDQQIYPFNIPLWSVFFEVVSNLIYALFYRLLLQPRILGGLVVFSAIALIYSAFATPLGLNVGWSGPTFVLGFARVMFSFFAGVGLYRLRKAGHLRRWAAGPILSSLVLMALLGQPFFRFSPVEQLIVVLIVLPVIVTMAAARPLDGAWLTVAKSLGDLSYPVYAVHFPILLMVSGLMKYLGVWDQTSLFVSGGLAFVIVVVTSAVVMHFYDIPIRRWLTSKLLQPKPGATT